MRSTSILLTVSLVALAGGLLFDGCAGQECDFHSQCGVGSYCSFGRCEQDCRMDFDCAASESCNEIGQCVAAFDAGPRPDSGPDPIDAGPGVDSGPIPMIDGGPFPVDSGPTPVDSGPTPIDSGPITGTGRYLDRCTSGTECTSGRCVDDVGGTRMCTIACSNHRDCASEHVCAGGQCVHDDTGTNCSTGSASACVLGLCIGNSTTGMGHCTRQCTNSSDCPAGYACADAGGTAVCVNIETSCSGPASCVTGLCLSAQGCTSYCRSAADCPQRFAGLPPYTCEIAFGSTAPICVPPSDIFGGDPIGTSCPITGTNTCRSDGCDTSAPTGPMCTQTCTQEGGCGPGLGCWPEVDVSSITFLCSRAGSRAIGQSCASGRECDSGLCDTSGYCTRLCTDDGLCPTAMRCETVPGFSVALCRR